MKTNQEFKNAALDALKGRWPQVLVATIVVVLMVLHLRMDFLVKFQKLRILLLIHRTFSNPWFSIFMKDSLLLFLKA